MNTSFNLKSAAHEQILSRRGFLSDAFSGLAGIGLASMLGPEVFSAVAPKAVPAGTWKPGNGLAQIRPQSQARAASLLSWRRVACRLVGA